MHGLQLGNRSRTTRAPKPPGTSCVGPVRPELNDDFLDVLHALAEAGADFIVVGAHALAAHGLIRATGDLGILVRPTRANAARVMSALRAFGAPLDAHGVRANDFETIGNVYQLGLAPRRIDLLTSISGVSFDEAWASRQAVRFGDVPASVLGKDVLIRNKRAAGRPRDLVDADELERL